MAGVENFNVKPQQLLLACQYREKKKKQEKGKVQSDTLEMQHNEKVKYYGGKI